MKAKTLLTVIMLGAAVPTWAEQPAAIPDPNNDPRLPKPLSNLNSKEFDKCEKKITDLVSIINHEYYEKTGVIGYLGGTASALFFTIIEYCGYKPSPGEFDATAREVFRACESNRFNKLSNADSVHFMQYDPDGVYMKKLIAECNRIYKEHNKEKVALEEMAATTLNLGGHLCAEVTSIRSLEDNVLRVSCIEYRNGDGRKVYALDLNTGRAVDIE